MTFNRKEIETCWTVHVKFGDSLWDIDILQQTTKIYSNKYTDPTKEMQYFGTANQSKIYFKISIFFLSLAINLTFTFLCANSADDKLAIFFFQKTGFNISYKLPPLWNVKTCFLGQVKVFKVCHLLKILPRMLSINLFTYWSTSFYINTNYSPHLPIPTTHAMSPTPTHTHTEELLHLGFYSLCFGPCCIYTVLFTNPAIHPHPPPLPPTLPHRNCFT